MDEILRIERAKIRTQAGKACVVSRWHGLLVMNANRFALCHRAESVRVALAPAVHKFATNATDWIVVVLLE